MDMFARELAPISGEAWNEIDSQTAAALRANLSARRFVDVKGPFGWDRSCLSLGTIEPFRNDGEVGYGVHKCVRFVETRVEFCLDKMDLQNIERGSRTADFAPAEKAAIAAAAFEDKLVYDGLSEAGIHGMKGGSELPAITLPDDAEGFLTAIKDAITAFEAEHTIGGPFVLVGGKKMRGALDKIIHGRTWAEVLAKNSEAGKFIYAPKLEGGFLLSARGGDLELSLGGDFTVGYKGEENGKLKFFIAESAAFRVIEPRAFVELKL